MIDKLHLTINNRVLKAAENLYSGESIVVEIEDPGLVQLTAADYNLVLFGADKSILAASEPFTASDSKWTATLNTATAAFQAYYENVSASTAKTLGLMIVSRTTGDTICAGTISATSVPFPSQTSSIPDLYGDAMATMAANKLDKVASAVENNMTVFDSAGGVRDSGVMIKRNVTVDQYGTSHGSLGIGNVRGIAGHDWSLAVGDFGYTDINGDNAVAVGMNCGAAEGGVAVGEEAGAEANSVAIGHVACTEDGNAVVIGADAGIVCESVGGTAVGNAASIEASTGAVALGRNARVENVANAVQLGQGANSTPGTLQFRSFPLMDAQGKIAAQALDANRIHGALGGRYIHCQTYEGRANDYVIPLDGLAKFNCYYVRCDGSYTGKVTFDLSTLGDDTFDILYLHLSATNGISRTKVFFRVPSEDNEGEYYDYDIRELDVYGAAIDWTSGYGDLFAMLMINGRYCDPKLITLGKRQERNS